VAFAAPAVASAATSTSSNWAGYAVSSPDPAAPVAYTSVSGSWVVPVASCSASPASFSAFWVGLGDFSETSQGLEQIGTESDCTPAGRATYGVWYELVPAASVGAGWAATSIELQSYTGADPSELSLDGGSFSGTWAAANS
jgi:hypothetical protein